MVKVENEHYSFCISLSFFLLPCIIPPRPSLEMPKHAGVFYRTGSSLSVQQKNAELGIDPVIGQSLSSQARFFKAVKRKLQEPQKCNLLSGHFNYMLKCYYGYIWIIFCPMTPKNALFSKFWKQSNQLTYCILFCFCVFYIQLLRWFWIQNKPEIISQLKCLTVFRGNVQQIYVPIVQPLT